MTGSNGGAPGVSGSNTGGANTAGPSTGGSNAGGVNSGGANTGGVATAGSSGATHSSGMGGVAGSGDGAGVGEGPCDIYAAAGTPCVAAYSTVRALTSAYTGPLYQVRSGSSAENTGSGGELHDIGMTADGFANAAAQDAACAESVCTVSLLYDHSGNGNRLAVGKAGSAAGGDRTAASRFPECLRPTR